jgi:hypothetical protein
VVGAALLVDEAVLLGAVVLVAIVVERVTFEVGLAIVLEVVLFRLGVDELLEV